MNAHITAAVLAVSQPTAEPGPFEGLANKFLGLLWAVSGWVGLAAFLIGAAVFIYEKWTMKNSSILSTLGGTLLFIGAGAMGAQIINWAMGS
ncbi:hypothetical protein IU443_28095 [Nocardia farcinica]|jgi:hypothetical protein|uniref:Uncharacterized protein n=1 Tax=Nocardia farcinica TaxID=37329 RepID=A0A449G5L9_NOCFR|nr:MULTISPECIES: hypothetical protein [Nocardia]MBF6393793.1 hypothetical protein [Nocardia farcinica]MBF6411253.1 hypothetical protein [Nocardia farcinica]MBF6588473.1 hypothetical protein [Nocardia farcinica]MCZ9330284.1 hypothetical protein [Nocardia farcinica]UEX26206.1 hypothetical protein LMJ57_30105 [Nocardia farcinica]